MNLTRISSLALALALGLIVVDGDASAGDWERKRRASGSGESHREVTREGADGESRTWKRDHKYEREEGRWRGTAARITCTPARVSG